MGFEIGRAFEAGRQEGLHERHHRDRDHDGFEGKGSLASTFRDISRDITQGKIGDALQDIRQLKHQLLG